MRLFRCLCLLILLGSGSGVSLPSSAVAAESSQASPPSIRVDKVRRHPLEITLRIDGTLKAKDMVSLSSSIEPLPIVGILADVGDKVEKGQVILRLDDSGLEAQQRQLEANILQARAVISQQEAQLDQATALSTETQRQFGRIEALADKGYASAQAFDAQKTAKINALSQVRLAQKALESAKAALKVTEAARDEIKIKRAKTVLKAPAPGVVAGRFASLGDTASTGTPLFSFIKEGILEFQADVPQQYLSKLHTGQKVTLFPVGTPPTEGIIRMLSPEVNEKTRQGVVYVSLGEEVGRLKAGMFSRGEILVSQKEALTIPSSALLNVQDRPFVWKVDSGGKVSQAFVTLGERSGEKIEVLEGLTEGETIVKIAGPFLSEGDIIKALES